MSWFLIKRFGRRPLITYGSMVLTTLLLIIGCISIPKGNQSTKNAMVALMAIWGFLYQLTIGAISSRRR
jgi:hypothetical protein